MDTTAAHEALLVNVSTGKADPIYIFKINDLVYEQVMQPGICFMFDGDLMIRDMIASGNDILADSIISLNGTHEYYCMIYNEDEQMLEEEVHSIFNGIQSGMLNIILLSESTSIPIISTNN